MVLLRTAASTDKEENEKPSSTDNMPLGDDNDDGDGGHDDEAREWLAVSMFKNFLSSVRQIKSILLCPICLKPLLG